MTQGYPIVGWRRAAVDGPCHLYRMPAEPESAAPRQGFAAAGYLVVRPPGSLALVSTTVGVEPRPLDVEVSSSLRRFGRVMLGASEVDEPTVLPVDLALTAPAEGEVSLGGIRVQGHEHRVVVVGRSGPSGGRPLRRAAMERAWVLAVAATRGAAARDRLLEELA